ncbi:Uncharacterised protein [Legionella lansingensis]|uniref:Uncharacterized protein n=1 Tax=Legionella lansingensis TaxID=45067 RepID=A0A0W0VKQ9_9GAMM|nr:hypothetical protein [Legionella lansingensis]KTD20390.1 hypothetical protein Llan_1891 [Legionella lansingensis]SNV51578.1 Uncharacterised protein [Legionella lansingensis]
MLNAIGYCLIYLLLFLAPQAIFAQDASQDLCQVALEKVYDKDSDNDDLIAVVKVNTTKDRLYSATTDISKDCTHFTQLLSVKDPDVVKGKNGLCMVLPAGELQPGLCSLRVTLCVSEEDCQSLDITLKKENEHYIAADPAYSEINFQ